MNMRRLFTIFFVALSVMMVSSCREKITPEEPDTPEVEQPEVETPEPPTSDPAPTTMTFYVSIPQPTSANDEDISLLDELHYALYSADPQDISYVMSAGLSQ